jgi:hypothetical protein
VRNYHYKGEALRRKALKQQDAKAGGVLVAKEVKRDR